MSISVCRNRGMAAAIPLLAILSSFTSAVNGFTYDDRYIVELNPLTWSLHRWWTVFATPYWPKEWGGDGYRPLTNLAFRLEWWIGHGVPAVFHVTNILLYALTAALVYALARRMLPQWAAWATAALFAVHPVHVEAVANVVGQSELIVGAALAGATLLYVRDRMAGHLRPITGIWILVLYAVACFSKEHGIVLPAILVAAELTVIPRTTSWRESIADVRWLYLAIFAIALGFVGVRAAVLGDRSLGGFQPYAPFSGLQTNARDRTLTAIGVVPVWFQLMYWPSHLSSEYGPPAIRIAQGFSIDQLPGLILLGATLLIALLVRRKRPVLSFGVAFGCAALLPSSNFLIAAGIVLAERTLFSPSIGAMLALGGALVAVADSLAEQQASLRTWSRVGAIALGLAVVAGAVRSAWRCTVWFDNEHLFRQVVIDSPDVYRAHYMLGAWAFEKKRLREGEAEYLEALRLFPYDPAVSYNLAEQYRGHGKCDRALPMYRWTHTLDKNYPFGHGAYAYCLLDEGQWDEAKVQARIAIVNGGPRNALHQVMHFADSARAAQLKSANAPNVAQAGVTNKLPDSVRKAMQHTGSQPMR